MRRLLATLLSAGEGDTARRGWRSVPQSIWDACVVGDYYNPDGCQETTR